MKKYFLLSILAAALVMLLAGCAGNRPSVCDGIQPGDSLLCQIAADHDIQLEDVGLALVAVNAVAIGEGLYTRDQAQEVINRLLLALDGSITYAVFRDRIMEYTEKYPGLLDVAQTYLDRFALSKQIRETDRDILRTFLQKRLKAL